MLPTQFYENQFNQAVLQIEKDLKKVRLFTFLRLFIFIVLSIVLYFSWGNSLLFIGVSFSGIALFLFVVSHSVDAKLALEKSKQLKTINENELKALQGDLSAFDSGNEFQDGLHAFSNDLDFFASKGMFSFLNRTTSPLGKRKLADLLLNGSIAPGKINKVITALQSEMVWTQNFRVSGSLSSRESGSHRSLGDWTKRVFTNPSWATWATWLIPIVSIPALILFNLDLISGLIFSLVLVASILPTGKLLKETNQVAEQLSQHEAKVSMLMEQIESLKKIQSQTPEISEIQAFFYRNEKNAADALKHWMKIQKRMELRANIVISIPLNLFLAWDLRQRLALENWKNNYAVDAEIWENKLAELESYISGATFLFNAPSSTFATFNETNSVEIHGLIHPLLSAKKAVKNNVSITENHQFMILTGPNMAGKSTYLRSIGLTFVLANAGFPITADSVSIPKVKIYSSMRTSDDLSNESSYFHAELMRLKFIMTAIEKGEPIFILLDEILKGTNSKDKAEGSKKFLQKLQRLGTKGIIATHDLSLCELENEHPAFINGCFDSIIEGENLSFDYTWKPGICKNMNASFLLHQLKLVD